MVKALEPCQSKLMTVTTASGRMPRTAALGWRSSNFNGSSLRAAVVGFREGFIGWAFCGSAVTDNITSSAPAMSRITRQ